MFGKDAACPLSPAEMEKVAQETLAQMTLKEKIWLLNGSFDPVDNLLRYRRVYNPVPIKAGGLPRLQIPSIQFSDGPRGVVMGRSTCFPVSMARGASFDRELERRIGDVIGKECRAQGANFFAGVCVNLLRHPAWGRAQETYGEDPFLVGEMGKSLTQGVQAHNVIACVKHYALNNSENNRFSVNVEVDDRALHEVYLPHFKKIIRAGAASVMGSYNKFRGDHACESRTLLTDILREQWGFEGFTISDFIFGVRNGAKAIHAGMDVEMPMPLRYQQKLLDAVERGKVSETVVDQAILRVLRTLLFFQLSPDPTTYGRSQVASTEHTNLALEAAERSMVLIRNENQVLPLSRQVKRILVLGRLATQINTGDRGSSAVAPPYAITPLQGLRTQLGSKVEIIHRDETQISEVRELASTVDCVVIVAGYDFVDEGEYMMPDDTNKVLDPIVTGYRNLGKPGKAAIIKLVQKVFKFVRGKLGVAHGGDRQNLSLNPAQCALIQAVAGVNSKTVVCLVCGSMIMLDDWAKNVPAVLYSWYAGMEGGVALARILFGEVNPSGKLPFTIPRKAEHLPYFSSTDERITYDLYHGYTLLDKNDVAPAYPFGFGLSYTTFDYCELTVVVQPTALEVKVSVTNSGPRTGAEVVQVYIGMDVSRVERQKKLLRGFEKVLIPSGETAEVTILISFDELHYYDEREQAWRLEPGTYRVMVGPNSDQATLLHTFVDLTGHEAVEALLLG